MTNRLANEISPYLLQHANNPVDWYPWGQEALERSRREQKPILLSIGYAACHWCHVMAHESFEDPPTAALINEHFVPIKVDREERPDLDAIYMQAVQLMTGSGGWPLNVFLTPDGVPFFGGTYFPPTSRHGMPSFKDIIVAVAEAWRDRRQEIIERRSGVVESIQRQMTIHEQPGFQECRFDTLHAAFRNTQLRFDESHGGWNGAPKFPQAMVLEFLLRYHHSTKRDEALEMVSKTLDAMARGGLFDQLGGGFHRYSVDAQWLVPHFEKMLYDNAQLARVYLHSWQVTGNPFHRTIVEETLDYVAREMTHPDGGFYATQDADSEGEEGKFYVWTPDEITAVLGDQASHFIKAYGVTDNGNFEGANTLSYSGSHEEREALAHARRQLLAAREHRVKPSRDEKVLTSWNGLMLAAFAESARTLRRDDYRQVAERSADFLLRELRTNDGRVWHVWKDGKARVNGYLADYACLVDGLLELYQATFDPRWYEAARNLADAMIDIFAAPVGFFDTSENHESPIIRPQGLQDNAVPSGNGMAAYVLTRLARLSGDLRYEELPHRAVCAMQLMMERYPLAHGQWLVALDYLLSPTCEIAIVGSPQSPDTRALLDVCTSEYRPHQIIAVGLPHTEGVSVPLLREHSALGGRAAAYVCINRVCLPPVTDPRELGELLGGSPSAAGPPANRLSA